MPGQAVHPPPPAPHQVRKYKSGSNAGHHVQTGGGGASAVSFGHSPADGVRGHRGGLDRGLFSIGLGWGGEGAVVTKLGEGGW